MQREFSLIQGAKGLDDGDEKKQNKEVVDKRGQCKISGDPKTPQFLVTDF
jgi:hypothetical protein